MSDNQNNEKNDNKNSKKETVKLIVFFAVLGVLAILAAVFKTELANLEDLMWERLQKWGVSLWLIPIILWTIGAFAWVATYIVPLLAARKKAHMSGIPGVAFVAFIIAGLLSPHKWLAVIALVDFEIVLLPIRLISRRKSNK